MPPILLAALVACISDQRALTFFDDDNDGAYTEYAEAYGATAPWDCDDGDADVHPGAREACGGGDENCDGTIDGSGADGESSWFPDSDGDDHGDKSGAVDACGAPVNYVASSDDCDDGDLGVHPGAVETCNGVDDDCDGNRDEAGATGETTWYADADKDGHGDAEASQSACDAPLGYVASADDCDDTDSSTAPGLAEICNDGSDNNCNGKADGCRLGGTTDLATTASQTLFGKNANDHLGVGAASGDLNNDGIDDLVIAVEGPSASDGGSVRVTFGAHGFTVASTPQVNLVGGGIAARPLGLCIARLTGDGVDDLVVSWGRSAGADHPDYAIYSGATMNGASTSASGAHIASGTVTTAPSATCGALKSATGDVLLAGNGGAWFSSPLTSARPLTSPDSAEAYSDYSAQDLDGDGWDDLWRHDAATETYGFYGPVTTLVGADFTLMGSGTYVPVLSAGDVNGDGHLDLLATAVNDGAGKGAGHVWYGTSTRYAGLIGSNSASRHITGPSSATPLYWAAFAGDVDGDGVDDVAASPFVHAGSPSAGWLIYGSSVVGGDAVAGADLTFIIPPQSVDGAPTAVSGDWNDDGRGDLLWSLPMAQSNAAAGVSFLVFGTGI